MKRTDRAAVAFSLEWESPTATHKENFFAEKIDFWRDFFPGDFGKRLSVLSPGESISADFEKGELVPPYDEKNIISFSEKEFERRRNGTDIQPLPGRFYPKGLAWKGLNCFSGNIQPFRIIECQNGRITGDMNHPLSRYPARLSAEYIEPLDVVEQHGGECNNISEMICENGPGMQADAPETETAFAGDMPLRRVNESDDAYFYNKPRFVNHLDDLAIDHVKRIYRPVLDGKKQILDLMSSWVSHLPDELKGFNLTGLGMNREELAANRQLAEYTVHDLNRSPRLPYLSGAFDAVICTASIEYLVRPLYVIEDVARVLRPGGTFCVTFSDRWFPGKEISVWGEMHPFERLGFVLSLFRKTGRFSSLHTETVRGYPRPVQDKHAGEFYYSDPVFAVSGVLAK